MARRKSSPVSPSAKASDFTRVGDGYVLKSDPTVRISRGMHETLRARDAGWASRKERDAVRQEMRARSGHVRRFWDRAQAQGASRAEFERRYAKAVSGGTGRKGGTFTNEFGQMLQWLGYEVSEDEDGLFSSPGIGKSDEALAS